MDNNRKYIWKKIVSAEDSKDAFEYYAQYPTNKIKFDLKNTTNKLLLVNEDLLNHNIFLLMLDGMVYGILWILFGMRPWKY